MNEREFEAKVLAQIDAIRRIGRKRLGRLSDLDDFTHEVVVRLYAARDQLRNEDLFPRWASVTAKNLVLSHVNWWRHLVPVCRLV